MNLLRAAQASDPSASRGLLQVNVVSIQNNFPISNASVSIASKMAPDQILERIFTNSSGQTQQVSLPAPPLEYSFEPGSPAPYSEYVISVEADGFRPLTVDGTEILPDATAIQPIRLTPDDQPETVSTILIPDHTLVGDYPPKIAESEIKPVNESGEIVLSRVVVPQTIVVHDGAPSNRNAKNYYVPYRDYIKNVASSEIYSTWPQATITANILAIMSFTLNRVYTEWYRNQGYDFTITSSTAFDHKWIYERNIYESISVIVDEIFDSYLSRPGVRQPILTQYCDGRQVQCPNWMTQWAPGLRLSVSIFLIFFLEILHGSSIVLSHLIDRIRSINKAPAFLHKLFHTHGRGIPPAPPIFPKNTLFFHFSKIFFKKYLLFFLICDTITEP